MGTLEKLQELRENAQDLSLNDNWREPRNPYENDNNDAIWLTSFTDVIALMLVFFVMMFSMSSPKEYGWVSIVKTMNNEFQTGVTADGLTGAYGSVDMTRVKQIKKLNTNYLSAIIKNLQAKEKILQKAELISFANKVRLTMKYSDIYDSKKPLEITENGKAILKVLTGNIGHLQNTMDIVLLASNANIKIGLQQVKNIAKLFRNAGYEGNINLIVQNSDKVEIAITIYSAK